MNSCERTFPVLHYDLAATLGSGQAFRWRRQGDAWVGVIGRNWVRLEMRGESIHAQTAGPIAKWSWLTEYLQIEVDLAKVLASFPEDEAMKAAVGACRGLRLLRQDPWECLASFILSSTKQIVQIQQIIGLLCERHGESVPSPERSVGAFSFPSPARLAQLTDAELRSCKMGFRAPYLLETARAIAEGRVDLEKLRNTSVNEAREKLMELAGVGAKIADCVLLFAYGFQDAFPVDVWVTRALRQLYFSQKRLTVKQLREFTATYFGCNAGYAQQYLFHYMRVHRPVPDNSRKTSPHHHPQKRRPASA